MKVVNCFQNSVSLIPTTTNVYRRYLNALLWIAFRIQYLWYQQQHFLALPIASDRCELLSEFSIFDTNNNTFLWRCSYRMVVNCFQNSVSLIPTTTESVTVCSTASLWIAFRIQYLWYQQQLPAVSEGDVISCELLSEFSIFDTNNNSHH